MRRVEKQWPNYAWDLLFSEMEVEGSELPSMKQLSRLIQMYMVGVEVLEGCCDQRYEHFRNKIKGLMVKKQVVELMMKESGAQKQHKEAMQECSRAERLAERQNHEAQVRYSQGNLGTVETLIKNSEVQLNKLKGTVNNGLQQQQEQLQQRIRLRRLRSESGSSNPQPQPLGSQEQIEPLSQYFQPADANRRVSRVNAVVNRNPRGFCSSEGRFTLKRSSTLIS